MFAANPRRGKLQLFRNTLYGMAFLLPTLRGTLLAALQAARGWNNLVPPHSPPPLSRDIVSACAAILWKVGRKSASGAILCAFHAFLRARELCPICWRDLCFPGDPRLSDFSEQARSGLVVRSAKTGTDQYVPLSDVVLLRCLRSMKRS